MGREENMTHLGDAVAAVTATVARASVGNVVFAVVTLVIAAWVANAVYNVFFHPLAHVPGPFMGKLSNLAFIREYVKGNDVEYDRKNFEKYGDVYRAAPNLLTFSNPAYLPLVYHRNSNKGDSYLITAPFGVIAIPSHAAHHAARRRLQSPFTVTAIKKTTPLVEDVLETWVDSLASHVESLAADGGVARFDFNTWPSYFTYDVLSELCFGKAFGFSRAKEDINGLIKAGDDSIVPLGVIVRWPILLRWANKLGLGGLTEVNEKTPGMGEFVKYRDMLMKERLENPSEKPDILNHLIKSWNPDGSPLSPSDIASLKEELLGIMTAGTDTSAQFLRDLIYQIGTHPDALKALYAEIPPSLSPTDSTASSPYLDACIRETLRLYPPATFPFPRTVDAPGLQLGKHFIPGGHGTHIELYASALNIARNTTVFGEDAGVWRPERWLNASAEEKAAWERASFAWGYSSRVCLGKPIAEVEVRALVKRVFERFVVEGVELVGGRKVEEMGELGVLHAGREGRLWMTLRKRDE